MLFRSEVERLPLNRIKKLTAANLGRNWVMIPAVTYHEDADITDLEAFRVLTNKENALRSAACGHERIVASNHGAKAKSVADGGLEHQLLAGRT